MFWDQSEDFLGLIPNSTAAAAAVGNASTAGGDGFAPEEWGQVLNLSRFTGKPMLAALCAPGLSRSLEVTPDGDVVASLLRALRRVYGAAVPAAPRHAIVTRWGRDPHALGSHSYYAGG